MHICAHNSPFPSHRLELAWIHSANPYQRSIRSTLCSQQFNTILNSFQLDNPSSSALSQMFLLIMHGNSIISGLIFHIAILYNVH